MKKCFVCFLIGVLTVVSFCGCTDSIDLSYKLAVCGSYAIPGMFCYDLKGGSFQTNILEEDDYGRILYEYTAESALSDNVETYWVVCQKIDSEFVYYYEDRCYLKQDEPNVDLYEFKFQNDWGNTLLSDKMTSRPINITGDLFISTDSGLVYDDLVLACCYAMDCETTELDELIFLDQDLNGNELYLIKTIYGEKYFVIVTEAYDVFFSEIVDREIDSEAIRSFKKSSGWN